MHFFLKKTPAKDTTVVVTVPNDDDGGDRADGLQVADPESNAGAADEDLRTIKYSLFAQMPQCCGFVESSTMYMKIGT